MSIKLFFRVYRENQPREYGTKMQVLFSVANVHNLTTFRVLFKLISIKTER